MARRLRRVGLTPVTQGLVDCRMNVFGVIVHGSVRVFSISGEVICDRMASHPALFSLLPV